MKKLTMCLMFITISFGILAQVPERMSHQIVIRNAGGAVVKNQVVGMQISILQGSASGTPIYVETYTPTTNANGLVSLEIGGGTIVTGTFAGIDWSSGVYFIKTETDPNGGTSYSITGTSQLLSVPYALYSNPFVYVSDVGDTMYLGKNKIIVPGISAANKLKDIEGNSYNTVKIGTQVWMAENLKTTKFKDGTSIPYETNDINWLNLTTPSYCWYDNDEATNKHVYGALYNWYTVNSGKLCPTGWHSPTDSEWNTLISYLGGKSVAGGKLKETGTTHWNSPNTAADNSSGFTGLPAGYRYGGVYGTFYQINRYAIWWASDIEHYRGVYCDNPTVTGDEALSPRTYGFSVRCIKDN
jgi:uncharacterized protein (TIGR02145 family)